MGSWDWTPEDRTMGIDSLLTGARSRWFLPGEDNVCILPQAMAPILGIDPTEVGETDVWILGRAYRVIGLFDGDAADRLRDLDNESPMTVDTVAEARKMVEMAELDPRLMDSAAIESFTHLMANNVVLLPYRQVADMGGSLRSITIADFSEPDAMLNRVEEFVSRVAVPLFVGEGERVRVYTSMGAAALSGIGNLFVPILIAALIVLNTMLGAVYERDREIGIYSSVGLAPNHIAALFIAEALVFATVGAVFGYLDWSDGQSDPGALRVAGGHVSELFVSLRYFHHGYSHGRGGHLNLVPGAQSRGHVRSRRDAALALPGARRG